MEKINLLPIIYRIIYPGLLTFIVFFVFSFKDFSKYYFEKSKKHLRDGIITLCSAIFALGLSIYYSRDLVYKDYITVDGTLIEHTRSNDVQKLEFLVDGKIMTVNILQFDYAELSLDEEYCFEFTYATRTNLILSIQQIS